MCVAILAMASMAFGQNTTATAKKVVVNPDGSYSVIEYPVDKDVVVDLVPGCVNSRKRCRSCAQVRGRHTFGL